MKRDLRIVFMGTPEFAVASLDILIKNNYNIVGIVTVPDKPAGRGLKLQESAVKNYAKNLNIPLLQPLKLKDDEFINQLKELKPNLQIVVAFRMLPEVVWSLPTFGTFNLHASLLPYYRGAAPINWAIINGDPTTGVTTFFLNDKIDCGKIIMQQRIDITDAENAGELHDKLKNIGSKLLLKTVNAIAINSFDTIEQVEIIKNQHQLKMAPKLFKNNCKIDWTKSCVEIYNFIRGLSPYPSAWTEFISPDGIKYGVKIYTALKETINHNQTIGSLLTDSNNTLKVAVEKGFIHIEHLQLNGKKSMNVRDFLRGFKIYEGWLAK